MKEPVLIIKGVFESGKEIFQRYSDVVEWIQIEGDEAVLSAAVRNAKARIVVLGGAKYTGDLYAALSQAAGADPAQMARFGVGYDGIDPEICKSLNIMLTVTRDTLDQSVAEHAIALLLSVVRDIPNLDRAIRNNSYRASPALELSGKIIGIAGLGAIGKCAARIAAKGFSMRVYAYDTLPLETQVEKLGTTRSEFMADLGIEDYQTDFAAIAGKLDFLSIHMPLIESTRNFFDRQRLAMLKPGAILVNTARGGLVDEIALYELLSSGRLKAAGLDVQAVEPYKPISPQCDLRNLQNVTLTPHCASNTTTARLKMAEKAMHNVLHFLKGEYDVLNRVV